MGRGREERERSEQVTLMERRSPNTRGLQERGNKAPEEREDGNECYPNATFETASGFQQTGQAPKRKFQLGKSNNAIDHSI